MTSGAPRQGEGLRCVLPPGWRRVDHTSLFELAAELGAEQGLDADALDRLRSLPATTGIVLVTVRTRGEILDIGTIALPPEGRSPKRTGRALAPAEPGRIVALDGGLAAIHETGVAGLPMQTQVQLITRVPPTGRGAILTLMSTGQGCESMLEHEAASLADSLKIEAVSVASAAAEPPREIHTLRLELFGLRRGVRSSQLAT